MFGMPPKNVGLFAAVLIGAMAVVMTVQFWLARQFGFGGVSGLAWFAPFAVACITAGQNYLNNFEGVWTTGERNRLAWAYSITASVIGSAHWFFNILTDADMPASFAVVFFFVLMAVLGCLISYAFARILLALAVRPRATKPALTSILSETEK
jgi:hypothetical protein